MARTHIGKEPCDLGGVAHVGGRRMRPAGSGAGGLHGFLQGVGAAPYQDHFLALYQQAQGAGLADTGVGAGDHDDLFICLSPR